MSDLYATSEERDRRGVRLAILALAGMLGGLYLVGLLFIGASVPDNTRVAGVGIGGLSHDEAVERLETELGHRVDDPIQLTWQGKQFQLDPEEAGLHLDVEATVRAAGGGRSWNPVRMTEILLTSGEVRPVIDVDKQALDGAVADIAQQIDVAAVEPRVVFAAGGERTVLQARSGHALDRQAVADDIVAAYLRSDRPVQLQIRAVEPTVDTADVNRALNDVAAPAISGPIRLRLPNRTVDLTVPQFAPALSLQGRDGSLAPTFDIGRLIQTTHVLRQQIDVRPQNARVVLRPGGPAIVPSRPGRRLVPANVAAAISPVLTRTGAARTVQIGTSTWEAPFTTEDARRLGIRRVVSSQMRSFPSAGYLNVNLRRATRLVNGTVLKPGDTFSFNESVGRRTPANGFTRGNAQRRGSARSPGGGVSLVSTALFNAAFFAGLGDVEHHNFAVYNDHYPLGRDAAVGWPGADLRFKNTTPYGVLIESWIDRSTSRHGGKVHVRMWSTKYWNVMAGKAQRFNVRPPDRTFDRSRRCRAQPGQAGFDVVVYRFFQRSGADKVDHKERMRASYLPSDRVICHPRPQRGPRGRGH